MRDHERSPLLEQLAELLGSQIVVVAAGHDHNGLLIERQQLVPLGGLPRRGKPARDLGLIRTGDIVQHGNRHPLGGQRSDQPVQRLVEPQ